MAKPKPVTPAPEAIEESTASVEVTGLNEQIAALTEARDLLQDKINEQDNEIRSLRSDNERLERESSQRLAQANEEAKKQIDYLERQLKARGPLKQGIDSIEGLSYPRPARDVKDKDGNVLVKGHPAEKARLEKWKQQGRTKCAHRACHFPLNILKDQDKQPIVMSSPDGTAFKAECSWDPRHMHPEGGSQYVLCETVVENAEK